MKKENKNITNAEVWKFCGHERRYGIKYEDVPELTEEEQKKFEKESLEE